MQIQSFRFDQMRFRPQLHSTQLSLSNAWGRHGDRSLKYAKMFQVTGCFFWGSLDTYGGTMELSEKWRWASGRGNQVAQRILFLVEINLSTASAHLECPKLLWSNTDVYQELVKPTEDSIKSNPIGIPPISTQSNVKISYVDFWNRAIVKRSSWWKNYDSSGFCMKHAPIKRISRENSK